MTVVYSCSKTLHCFVCVCFLPRTKSGDKKEVRHFAIETLCHMMTQPSTQNEEDWSSRLLSFLLLHSHFKIVKANKTVDLVSSFLLASSLFACNYIFLQNVAFQCHQVPQIELNAEARQTFQTFVKQALRRLSTHQPGEFLIILSYFSSSFCYVVFTQKIALSLQKRAKNQAIYVS